MRLVLALLGLLLLAPPALAQDPATLCGPITATAAAPAPMAAGAAGTVTLVVTNAGQLAVRASASMNIREEGWEFDADAPSAILIAPQDSASFLFAVRATESATTDALPTLTARGVCEPAGPLPCPPQACSVEAEPVQTRIQFRQAEGLNIPGLSNLDFPPEYLVASLVLVGLVAAIVVLARRPARGVAADCPEPLKQVKAGRGASFPIEVRNAGGEPVTAQLEVGAVPEGWSAFMPLPDVQLAARESRNLFLMVRAPEQAGVGDAVDVEVMVRNPARPEKTTTVRVRAEVAADTA